MEKVHLHAVTVCNLGDDLFLNIIINRYKDTKFYLFTNEKKYKEILNYDNCKIYSNKIVYILKKIIFNFNFFHIKKNFTHISIGGSIFGEIDSKLYWKLNKFENDYKGYKRYFIIGCNFGPYFTDKYLKLHHDKVFKNADDVCFREKKSYELFKDLKSCRYRSDIVFSMDIEKYKTKSEKKVVFSIIKPSFRKNLQGYDEIYENKVVEMINFFSKLNYKITLMSFCKLEQDETFINYLIEKYNLNEVNTYFYDGDIDWALNEISTSEYVVATRFHAMILGILFDKLVLPIVYSDKTSNVLEDLNFSSPIAFIDKLDEFDIEKEFKRIKKYNGNLSSIREKAEEQFSVIDMYLK